MAVGTELHGLQVKQLHVGGLPLSSKEEAPQGLVGCVQVGVCMETGYRDIEVSGQMTAS